MGCSPGPKTAASDQWQTPTEWALLMAQQEKQVYLHCRMLNDIARAQLAAGEKEQALQTLKPTLELIAKTDGLVGKNSTQEAIIKTVLELGEYESAIQTAENFTNPSLTDPIFKEIAFALIEAGKVSEAVEAVQKLKNEGSAIRVCESVAGALVQKGQQQQAMEFVEQIPQLNIKGAALCAMAVVYFEQGDSRQAYELLKPVENMYEKVDDETKIDQLMTRRDQLLTKFVNALARGGNSKRALEFTEFIKDRDFAAVVAYQSVIVTLIASSDVKQALKIANKIEDLESRNREQQKIAEIIARDSDDYEQAMEISNKIQNSGFQYSTIKFDALANIAVTIASKSGDYERALKVIDAIGEKENAAERKYYKKSALEDLTVVAAQSGKGEQTLALVQQIPDLEKIDPLRSLFLENVVVNLIETDNWKSATQVVNLVPSPEIQSRLLLLIANELARKGETAEALGITQKIKENRRKDSALSLVAARMSEAGNTDDALKAASQIIDKSEQAETFISIASKMLRMGNEAKGIAVLSKALDLISKNKTISARVYLEMAVMPLACEPLTTAQQKVADKDIVTPLKKSFTPGEKRVANRLLQAVQAK
ncbi:Anaphase-promoting complex, cyclosome, subunit 3 [Gimesia panareensis]|uniref:Anaphase-promoting complex, cyclosome, subunit 3 n=2 Tax=Gimesia panareensis TaxID=2527978 RepID=A0A517PZL3_9PLAN|nr:Anaphase-promoting complex, cyclosome, subunit 3 [Gimesia panareensis]